MYKKITSYIGEYRLASILCPLFVLLEVIMDIALPYLMSIMIDDGITSGSKDKILRIAVYLMIVIVIQLVSGSLSATYATMASSGLAKNLRNAMFRNIQSLSFEDVEKFSTGSLVTRMTTDVQSVQMSYQMSIRLALRAPLMIFFAFFMSFRINRPISFCFLLVAPIIIIGLYLVMSRAFPIFKVVNRTLDKLNNQVSENLLGIRVIKSFNKEEHETNKFKEITKKMYKLYLKVGYLFANMEPLMFLAVYVLYIVIAWFGTHSILKGTLQVGELVSLTAYSFQIQMSLMFLAMVVMQIITSRNSMSRIIEVLDYTPTLSPNEDGLKDIKDGSIEFKNVNFSYLGEESKLALENINLKIDEADNVGIIGPTGSSKSTLVNLIPRLYDVTSGEILVGGVNVKDYNLKSLRDSVSVVLQSNVLFSGTLIENLRWGNKDATMDEIIEACKIADIHDFIMQNPNGYDQIVERGGTNFSGGQKQRICIARALLKNPKILILDDSTSALDNATEQRIVKELKEKRPNLTKITISQRITSLKGCDYIIVLDKGEITGIGTHEELIKTNEIYRDIAITQSQGGEDE